VARIEVAPEVAGDLDRIVDHVTQHEASRIDERVAGLIDAIEVLTHSPLMGRPVRQDLRELIVGRAAEGYFILYEYIPEIDTAFVLAARSGREACYADRDDVDSRRSAQIGRKLPDRCGREKFHFRRMISRHRHSYPRMYDVRTSEHGPQG
jgi:toxin ParE1/3/4